MKEIKIRVDNSNSLKKGDKVIYKGIKFTVGLLNGYKVWLVGESGIVEQLFELDNIDIIEHPDSEHMVNKYAGKFIHDIATGNIYEIRNCKEIIADIRWKHGLINSPILTEDRVIELSEDFLSETMGSIFKKSSILRYSIVDNQKLLEFIKYRISV